MNQMIQPGYGNGFARHAGESMFPSLWDGLVWSFVPAFGPTGGIFRDFSAGTPAPIVNANYVGQWQTPPGLKRINEYASSKFLTPGNPAKVQVANGDFSVFCSFKLPAAAGIYGYPSFVSKYSWSDGWGLFGIKTSMAAAFYVYRSDTNAQAVSGNNALVAEKRHTLCGVNRGLTAALWVDGTNRDQSDGIGSVIDTIDLHIGLKSDAYPQSMSSSTYYSVLLYRRALTEQEIRLLNQWPTAPFILARLTRFNQTSEGSALLLRLMDEGLVISCN